MKMGVLKTRKALGVVLLVLVAAGLLAYEVLIGFPRPHNPKVFGPPEKTLWKPVGARAASDQKYDIIPEPDTFHALHVGMTNSDSVWTAVAPMYQFDWISEPAYFTGTGPTFDNEGNLYFTPGFYHGDPVALISLDAETGKRRWAIPAEGKRERSGAVFHLNDPETPGTQIIYFVSYTRALAVRPDGSIVWSTKTGLKPPPIVPGKNPSNNMLGFNYHPATDTLVTVSKAGQLFAFDRKTGKMKASIGQVPGAPAISANGTKVSKRITDKVDPVMEQAFGKTEGGLGIFSSAVNYIYGGGGIVTNYFSVDPDSSRIYIAATAPDEEDGTKDGQSEIGAIYAFELKDRGDGTLEFQVVDRATFKGGTGSTPALSADGSRVYVSDNEGHVLALDSNLEEVWRVDVGEPLVGSITVSPDNNEIYAVTRNDVFQLIDDGESGRVRWTGELTGFDGWSNVRKQSNALTATVTANGVLVAIGGGKSLLGNNVMLHMGMGLLDRDTGKLRYFAAGGEDSVSVSGVGPDGSIYVANSPLRRAVGRALFPDLTPPVTGGITRFKPIRLDLLGRDAICAAAARAANASTLNPSTQLAAIATDIRQIKVLLNQARNASKKAVGDGDMTKERAAELGRLLNEGSVHLAPASLSRSVPKFAAACARFD